MKIAVITTEFTSIKIYLETNTTDSEVIGFSDIYEFKRRVDSSPLRVDTLLIMDNGMRDSKYNSRTAEEAFGILKDILENNNLVDIGRVLYLNTERKKRELELINFIAGSKNLRTKIIVTTYPGYKAITIKELLLQSSTTYVQSNSEYKMVIKKDRNVTDPYSKLLSSMDSNKTMVVEYKTYNPEIKNIKESIIPLIGDDKLKKIISDDTIIDNIEIDNEFENKPLYGTKEKCKLIGVTGESKSGATIASMILGVTASNSSKTLLVDLNYTNLGLSYLVEKTLKPEEFHNIKLSSFITSENKLLEIRDARFHGHKLHILTNSLPIKKILNQEQYGFVINNIINLYKNSYDYIVFDIDIDSIENYSYIMNILDKLILTTPPYINNIVSLLTKIKEKTISNSKSFEIIENDEFRDLTILRTKVFSRVNREIKPIKSETIDKYTKNFLGAKVPVTSIYEYSGKSYTDTILFKSVIKERGE